MTIQESYKVVITAEIRAQKMYAALAKSFGNSETSSVFTELVMLEKNHEDKVRKLYAEMFPGQTLDLGEIKENELKSVNLSDPKEVLEFAITREELAHNNYSSLAEQATDPAAKELLLQFAQEESKHKNLLLTEIQRLQGALSWFDPSELNGLMEH